MLRIGKTMHPFTKLRIASLFLSWPNETRVALRGAYIINEMVHLLGWHMYVCNVCVYERCIITDEQCSNELSMYMHAHVLQQHPPQSLI